MKDCVITFRSITPAQRAEQVLRSKGISCRMLRTQRWMEARGCGYSLNLPIFLAMQAVELLRENQIPFQKIYQIQAGSKPEEMQL